MRKDEYKEIFKSFPERAWLATTLQKLLRSRKFDEVVDYLVGEKSIDDLKDIEDLYKLKSAFFFLKADCDMIVKYIDILKLDYIGEFEDVKMDMEDIGITKDDVFVCKQSFQYMDMIQVNEGSEIQIDELSFAGKASHVEGKFLKLNTNEKTRKHFPDMSKIKVLLVLNELERFFIKK